MRKHNKPVLILFITAAIIGAVLFFFVDVNYNMADYLPPDAKSTQAIEIMEDEFGGSMPNTSVMISDVSIQHALSYKEQLKKVDGVSEVIWLDDVIDVTEPVEMTDMDTVEGYYKNNNALFTITIADGMERSAVDDIRELIGDDNAISGDAPDLAAMQDATVREVLSAVAILLPIIILLLTISTTSWIEPLLFLATIGVAILINLGSNIIFGEVSFMTNSVSPILQLAVSLDYTIFMLHNFAANRKKHGDVNVAMKHAIRESRSTIAASAATTLFGFLALTFMDFQIGADLGINLAKGIILSYITTMVFLPALTLTLYKVIDKTQHRPFLPSFKNVNNILSKLSVPAIIIVVILIVPSYVGQGYTGFIYGNGDPDPNNPVNKGSIEIQEEFGQSTTMVLLVPRGDVAKESALVQKLKEQDHVTSVVSYTDAVGNSLPPEFLDDDITSQFYSDEHARIIATLNTPAEGTLAFETVEEILAITKSYYGDSVYYAGESANLYDMKNVVTEDNQSVTLIAVAAIFLVLIVTFRSATLPFILLLTIEAGIWINLAIPYFEGIEINFIGYLVINTVQLGATIDYAILLTNTYIRNRRILPRHEAMHTAVASSFKSILVSAATLATAGFTLCGTSTNPAVSDLGLLLGRGTVFSFIMVLCFLPEVLKLFDKAINKTTFRANFVFQKSHIDDDEAELILGK